mmetsp:Transcript_612/g.848  ORF Transcript_612/g.848 Transcript_612/m.848 type:complete len:149 (-) Transcript_612:818-1264(-)
MDNTGRNSRHLEKNFVSGNTQTGFRGRFSSSVHARTAAASLPEATLIHGSGVSGGSRNNGSPHLGAPNVRLAKLPPRPAAARNGCRSSGGGANCLAVSIEAWVGVAAVLGRAEIVALALLATHCCRNLVASGLKPLAATTRDGAHRPL